MEHLLSVRHYAKYFTHVISLYFKDEESEV